MRKIAKNTILMVALFMGLISGVKAFTKAQSTWYYNGNTTESNFFLAGQWIENTNPGGSCDDSEVRPCQLLAENATALQALLDGFNDDVDALFADAGSKP